MKKSIPRRLQIVLICLVFLMGLSLLLYPMFSNWWNQRRQSQMIDDYTEQTQQISDDDSAEWLAKADAYNKTLKGKGVPDAFAEVSPKEDKEYQSQLAFRDDGMMGYIKIPRISVNLPIYHTTSEESLQKGVGHLQGSALPVGGKSTHCVLSAHRGLPSAALFTDLDMLQIGDHFYIYVLDRSLEYEVDQIKVVQPDQTQDLNVESGKDLVTLVTCTPYGVNTQRLLVRGHRVPYDENDGKNEGDNSLQSPHTRYGLWAAIGLAATAAFSLLLYWRYRKDMNGKWNKKGRRK